MLSCGKKNNTCNQLHATRSRIINLDLIILPTTPFFWPPFIFYPIPRLTCTFPRHRSYTRFMCNPLEKSAKINGKCLPRGLALAIYLTISAYQVVVIWSYLILLSDYNSLVLTFEESMGYKVHNQFSLVLLFADHNFYIFPIEVRVSLFHSQMHKHT